MAHGDITHIDIPVTDTDQARRFYSELFGWTIEELPGFEGYPMWQAPNKISGGGLAPRSDGFTQPRSYVEVDSIEQALATAEQNGGRVLQGKQPITESNWWAVFEDPFGNQIGLFEGTTAT